MDEIHNCGWKFRVQCPLRWDQLAETADPKVRQCGVCLCNVYWCDSAEQATAHAEQGHCIALHTAEEEDGTLGALMPWS